MACLRIDLLNAILSDLKQMLAVESGSCICSNIDRVRRLSIFRIEGIQLVAGCKPNVLPVKRHAMHAVGAWKGAVLAEDFCR
jgi:hypothetical protein